MYVPNVCRTFIRQPYLLETICYRFCLPRLDCIEFTSGDEKLNRFWAQLCMTL